MQTLLLHTQAVKFRRCGAIAAAILLLLLGCQGIKAWQYQAAGKVPPLAQACLPQAERT